MMRTAVFLLIALAARSAAAEPDMHAGELAHALDRLGTTARVLYVAAHPDDENTRLLAYLANVRHLQVGYLSMTRGGGGQNLIGSEQGELLDIIRTEELLAARRLDGARQFFTGARDFGYSKTAKETLERWGHEQALGDVVWVIRSFQPDVIITRFSENPPNHGHHTASAILAREAFRAAADPGRFPEQLERGVKPWAAQRLLLNLPSWRDAPPPPPGAFEVDVGGWDPRLGLSMGELAARSRSQHKSQGFGATPDRGRLTERFILVDGKGPVSDLLAGVALGWGRYGAAARPWQSALAEAQRTLERDHPEKALPQLVRAHQALDKLPDDVRVREARAQLTEIIAAAAGLHVRATAPAPVAAPGTTVEVTVEVVARATGDLRQVTVGTVVLDTLKQGDKQLVPHRLTTATGATPTVGFGFTLAGRKLSLERPVVFAWTDPVHGERVRPFLVVPPATVTPLREAVLFPGGRARRVTLRVRAAVDGVQGRLRLPVPQGWRVAPAEQPVALAKAGDETTVDFEVTPGTAAADVRPTLTVGAAEWSLREDVIDHAHIPFQLVLRPSSVRLVPLAIELPRGRIGHIAGPGDSVADDLRHVGVTVVDLDDAALRGGDLDGFAAILVGIRAYNTRAAVRAAQPRLMAYVERGGTLVVQYNTQNRISETGGPIGPFPFEISRDRITDENAAPRFVAPAHPAMTRPNRLGPADFAGWVQERGIYFAAKWDAKYQPLFAFADPGEQPLEGSTLVAAHGKGRYVYTGLAFFRQLPAGVPGAYRLLANLLAGKR